MKGDVRSKTASGQGYRVWARKGWWIGGSGWCERKYDIYFGIASALIVEKARWVGRRSGEFGNRNVVEQPNLRDAFDIAGVPF